MNSAENRVHYIEIVTPDPDATRAQYEQLLECSFKPPDPVLGGAYIVELPGASLCGIRAPMHDSETPKIRIYMRVDDLADAIDRASKLGAEILLDRMELPGYGFIAIYSVGGNEHGIWQVS